MWVPFLLWSCAGDVEVASEDPGRVLLHRLNRAEYDNTVRDLFGTTLRPAERFPADDFGVGFDNQAHILSLSPLHIEQYDQAADELLDELFAVGTLAPTVWTIEAEGSEATADNGAIWDATAWVLWSEGAITAEVWLPVTGDYTVAVDVFGLQAGDDLVRMALSVDGTDVQVVDVAAEGQAERVEVRMTLAEGRHDVAAAFLNDLKLPPEVDRNLVVDRFELVGPLDVPRVPPAGRDRVLSCDPTVLGEAPCAEQILRSFGRRGWRRPLAEHEVAAKMALYGLARDGGGDWAEGVRALIKGVLLSPNFIYRVEPEAPTGGAHPLGGFELAARLSYFLWSTTPDDRLLDLAQAGTLTDPAVLEAEARRMLRDPRASALVDNLGGQWLGIRKVAEAQPSVGDFPAWDEGLRASMQDELTAFVGGILLSDRSTLELMTATDTMVDPRLAEHYGLDIPPAGLHAADTPDRPGLIGRAGWLTSLSYPTRTSPVLRGKWVLENLLCAPPPAPPSDVPSLEDQGGTEPETLREQLERHRADPACAGCHLSMDAIGLGLETYDALGRWRDVDEAGNPIDPSGELPGLGPFEGPSELAALLATDPRFPRCMAEKTFTYALGRPPNPEDGLTMEAAELALAESDFRFEALVVSLVRSRPFRWQGAP